LISWKNSFRKLGEEYEMAKKKKQALDNLLNSNRISHSTYALINNEIEEAIHEIEKQRKALLDKMNSKMIELQEQIKIMEMLLANFEIQHVTGEVDENVYQQEISLLSMGLETSKSELEAMQSAINQLSTSESYTATINTLQEREQSSENDTKIEKPDVGASETETEKSSSESTEAFQDSEESQPVEIAVETEKKQDI